MNIEYGKILTNAWNITWKHKILWFFAFLIVLVSGNASFGSGVNNRFSGGNVATGTANLPPDLQNIVNQLNQIDLSQVWGYIAIGVACLIILWVVLFVLSIIGQGGLIGGILQADSSGSVSFREAWALGRKYFWRLLLIAVFEFIVILLTVLVLLIPAVLIAVFPLGVFCLLPLCCGLVLLLMVFSFYMYLVRIAVVADDADLGMAFGRALTMLREKIGPFIILGLIIFGIALVVGLATLVLALPAGIALLGAFWPWIQNTGSINMTVLYLGGFFLLVFILLSLLIRSVLETWTYAVYAIAYRQFAKPQTSPTSVVQSV